MRYWLFALPPVVLVAGYFVFYFYPDQFGAFMGSLSSLRLPQPNLGHLWPHFH
jgi:hypothetical protein